MINLPHQEPIRFIKDLIEQKGETLFVGCSFPFIPSLPMVCESVAQATAAFSKDDCSQKIAFLVSMKNIEKIKDFDCLDYQVKIKKVFDFANMSEYEFSLISMDFIYAKGNLTISF